MYKSIINIKRTAVMTISGVAIAISSNYTNAQSLNFKAGLNLSRMETFYEGQKTSTDYVESGPTYSSERKYKMLPGFHIGTSFEFNIGKYFSIEPGIQFSTKGMKNTYNSESNYTSLGQSYSYINSNTSVLRTNNIDVPVLFHGILPIGDNVKLYATLGGYVGVGLTGKIIYRGETEQIDNGVSSTYNEKDEGSINYGPSEDLSRLDFGAIGGIGVELKGFFLEANYNYGFANLVPKNYADKSRANNRVIGITFGYKIKFKKDDV